MPAAGWAGRGRTHWTVGEKRIYIDQRSTKATSTCRSGGVQCSNAKTVHKVLST